MLLTQACSAIIATVIAVEKHEDLIPSHYIALYRCHMPCIEYHNDALKKATQTVLLPFCRRVSDFGKVK